METWQLGKNSPFPKRSSGSKLGIPHDQNDQNPLIRGRHLKRPHVQVGRGENKQTRFLKAKKRGAERQTSPEKQRKQIVFLTNMVVLVEFLYIRNS